EEPAQGADLVPPSGQLAVEVDADAAQREDQQCPAVTVRAAELGPEDEPQEERHTEEPRHAEDVEDGEDAVRLDACLLDRHPGASCGNTCVNVAPLLYINEKQLRLSRCMPDSRSSNGHRRRPTLPQGLPCSTIGSVRLSFRVRNVTGRFPYATTTESL